MKLSQLLGKPTEREWLNVAIASAAPRIWSSDDENSVAAMLATAQTILKGRLAQDAIIDACGGHFIAGRSVAQATWSDHRTRGTALAGLPQSL
jgi:hypothetical protein